MSEYVLDRHREGGRAVAVDLDLSLVEADMPSLSFARQTSSPDQSSREILIW